jgi:hypothetical protein
LTSLRIDGAEMRNEQQLTIIRGIASITHLDMGESLTLPEMAILTAPSPQQLRSFTWADLFNEDENADAIGDTIGSLPTLETVDIKCAHRFTRMNWLAPLSRITSIALDFAYCNNDSVTNMTPDALVQGLQMLPSLTRLYMDEPPNFETIHLACVLKGFPVLRTLELRFLRQVNSLSFLSCSPPSLTALTLDAFCSEELRGAEILHIVAHCKALIMLQIEAGFAKRLGESVVALFTPPSKVLPLLRHFRFKKSF